MKGLLELGHRYAWSKPYHARKVAIERCIARAEHDPTRKAALECALQRITTAENLHNALTGNQ